MANRKAISVRSRQMFRFLLFASMFCGTMAYGQSAWRSSGNNVAVPPAQLSTEFVTVGEGTSNTTFDVFPLDIGSVSKYNVYAYSAYYEFVLVNLSLDSGFVEYTVIAKTSTDTSFEWRIKQVRSLDSRRYFRGRFDSAYYQQDTSYFILTEIGQGRHEIRCTSMVWLFPLSSPTEPVYRYSDTAHVFLLRPSSFGNGYDSLLFSVESGFHFRRRFNYFSGVTQSISRLNVTLVEPVTFSPEFMENVSKFVLSQNFPNPFNPTTTIEFHIPRASLVTLRVFDILGREVATLVNEEMEPGRHAREFAGSGLASGFYLYRLRAGDFVQTRKLVLVR